MTHHVPDDPSRDPLVARVRDALEARTPDAATLAAIRARLDAGQVRGGTTLRATHRAPRWWIGGAALAAAAAIIVIVAVPAVDRSTTVSAAEILGRSRAALSTPVSGIEVLTYDLSVEGVLADLVPAEQAGRFTVEETIDHDREGRYRLRKLAPGGDVVFAIADDSAKEIRSRYLRANGRGYLLRFSEAPAAATVSVPAVRRMALQAFITMMQASKDPALHETTCDGEACYEITVPGASAGAAGLVTLSTARALVTAADARIVEFSAAGSIAERPFGLDFALRSRIVREPAADDAAAFELTPRTGDVVLEGNASKNPMWDVVERALAAIPAASAPRSGDNQR